MSEPVFCNLSKCKEARRNESCEICHMRVYGKCVCAICDWQFEVLPTFSQKKGIKDRMFKLQGGLRKSQWWLRERLLKCAVICADVVRNLQFCALRSIAQDVCLNITNHIGAECVYVIDGHLSSQWRKLVREAWF